MKRRGFFSTIGGWFVGFVTAGVVTNAHTNVGNKPPTSPNIDLNKIPLNKQVNPFREWGWSDAQDHFYETIWNTVELPPALRKEAELVKEAYGLWLTAIDGVMEAMQKYDKTGLNAKKTIREVFGRWLAAVSLETEKERKEGKGRITHVHKQYIKLEQEMSAIRRIVSEKIEILQGMDWKPRS